MAGQRLRRWRFFSTLVAALVGCLVLVSPARAVAARPAAEPTALYMSADLLIARPVLLVMTAVGTVFWVASLPFSLLGGNAADAADTLIVGPAKQTFTRCLGCRTAE